MFDDASLTLRLTSAAGLPVMVLLAWLLSAHRWRVPWRVVFAGLALQLGAAVLMLRTPFGTWFFKASNVVFETMLASVEAGSTFVFGDGYAEHYFAFFVLPSIVVFSALASLLHHLGILQWVVRGFGAVMRWTLGTSGAESLAAAANVFVGQTEAPLFVRPYLNRMTPSELMTVMCGGFATVAGGVLVAYYGMGIDAGHLLTASLISAPAALLIGKVMQPEVDVPQTAGAARVDIPVESVNALDAASVGAADGMKLALNVGAMMIAFLGLIALVNLGLGGLHSVAVYWEWADQDSVWSLQAGLGYLGAPFAFLMGVPHGECRTIGELLGLKTVVNEFVAYAELATIPVLDADGEVIRRLLPETADADAVVAGVGAGEVRTLSERSRMIVTYALCGFANFASVGVQIGALSFLAPERKAVIAKLALRAMLGGTLAAFMTGCVAGVLG